MLLSRSSGGSLGEKACTSVRNIPGVQYVCACTHSVMLLCMGRLLYSTLTRNEIRDTIQPTVVIGMKESRKSGSSCMTELSYPKLNECVVTGH